MEQPNQKSKTEEPKRIPKCPMMGDTPCAECRWLTKITQGEGGNVIVTMCPFHALVLIAYAMTSKQPPAKEINLPPGFNPRRIN